MKKNFFRLSWLKGIFIFILTIIFLIYSQIFATIGGEMAESGFPLHYRLDTFCMPEPTLPYLCTGNTEIYYKNLIIDCVFWLIISYFLVCFILWIFYKIRNK